MERIVSIRGKAKPKSPLPSRLFLRAKNFPKTGREPWEAGSRLWIKGPLDRGVPAQKGPAGSFRAQSQARSDTRRRSNSSRITWRKPPIRGTGALQNELSHVFQQTSPAGWRQLVLRKKARHRRCLGRCSMVVRRTAVPEVGFGHDHSTLPQRSRSASRWSLRPRTVSGKRRRRSSGASSFRPAR